MFSKEEESGEMRPENCNEVWDGNWMAWKREEIIREKKVNKYPFWLRLYAVLKTEEMWCIESNPDIA